jgi:hypothetical protein
METMSMTKEEAARRAMSDRMRNAIVDEMCPSKSQHEEEIFENIDKHVALGAIASLAASLITFVGAANSDVDWPKMVAEVNAELARWSLEE